MSNLNQIQKEFLKKVSNVERWKYGKRLFKQINKENAGLTPNQLYCIDNTVYNDKARKKLIKIFREENLMNNLNLSIN